MMPIIRECIQIVSNQKYIFFKMTSGIYFAKVLCTQKTSRASIVPYCIKENGEVKFVFAVDSKYGDITDLGGGVRKYESAFTGAIREFTEESHCIFGEIQMNNIDHSLSLIHSNMATIFVRYDEKTIYCSVKQFNASHKKTGTCDEIASLVILNAYEITNLTRNPRYKWNNRVMWGRVRRFYYHFNMKSISSILTLLEKNR